MGDMLATLPLTPTDSSLFGGVSSDQNLYGGIPTYDPGINVASNGNLLDQLANFSSKIGSSVSGVLNTVRFGTGPNSPYAVQAQQQAVANSHSTIIIIALLVGAIFVFKK